MKIVLINTLFGSKNVTGGAERCVQLLAQWLINSHQVTVLALEPGREAHQRTIDGINVIHLGLGNLYWPFDNSARSASKKMLWHLIDTWNPIMARAVKTILRDQHPDILHTHNLTGFSAAVWMSARQLNIPIVHTLHDYSLICPKTTMFKNGKNCEMQCTNCHLFASPRLMATSMVQAVTGVSQFTLRRHLDFGGFGKSRIRKVVRNEAELYVHPSKKQRSRLKLRLGYMGRLDRVKGIESLLECIESLGDPAVELFVAGAGQPAYENYLRSRYDKNGIHFVGLISPANFYPRIDALVLPSLWHEPMARVMVDAFGYGIPIIGTWRGGIPEFILQNEAGWLYEPEFPQELKEIILMLRHSPELISYMQVNISKKEPTSRNSIHQEYFEIYKDLLHGTTLQTDDL